MSEFSLGNYQLAYLGSPFLRAQTIKPFPSRYKSYGGVYVQPPPKNNRRRFERAAHNQRVQDSYRLARQRNSRLSSNNRQYNPTPAVSSAPRPKKTVRFCVPPSPAYQSDQRMVHSFRPNTIVQARPVNRPRPHFVASTRLSGIVQVRPEDNWLRQVSILLREVTQVAKNNQKKSVFAVKGGRIGFDQTISFDEEPFKVNGRKSFLLIGKRMEKGKIQVFLPWKSGYPNLTWEERRLFIKGDRSERLSGQHRMHLEQLVRAVNSSLATRG